MNKEYSKDYRLIQNKDRSFHRQFNEHEQRRTKSKKIPLKCPKGVENGIMVVLVLGDDSST